jgi:hypothetical protein
MDILAGEDETPIHCLSLRTSYNASILMGLGVGVHGKQGNARGRERKDGKKAGVGVAENAAFPASEREIGEQGGRESTRGGCFPFVASE